MRYFFFLIAFCATIWAQDEKKVEEPIAAEPATSTVETEEQENIRSISLESLRNADDELSKDREVLVKRERRITALIEDLQNQTQTIDNKEANLQKLLLDQQQSLQQNEIPPIQVAHWEARDPIVAAQDFVLLYKKTPKVAVALVKHMKKKKSANLIDQVALLGDEGKNVAAKLHEAIGTGQLKQ